MQQQKGRLYAFSAVATKSSNREGQESMSSQRKRLKKRAEQLHPGKKVEWKDNRLHVDGQPIETLGGSAVPVIESPKSPEKPSPTWPERYQKAATLSRRPGRGFSIFQS